MKGNASLYQLQPERGPPWQRVYLLTNRLRVVLVAGVSLFILLTTAPIASAVPSRADFFGLSSFSQISSESEAADIRTLGINNVRANITWGEREELACDGRVTQRGWTATDERIRRAAQAGITLVVDLVGLRQSPDCGGNQFPLQEASDYRNYTAVGGFAWQVVQRYGYNGEYWLSNPGVPYRPVKVWEVWNEPNRAINNPGGTTIRPQAYAKFLIDVARTIRDAQRAQSGEAGGTTVLMGGLGSSIQTGEFMPATEFLNRAYAATERYTSAQLHAAYDGLSAHPYHFRINGATFDERVRNAATTIAEDIRFLRRALRDVGDQTKTLWLTEIGWPVFSTTETPAVTITQSEQAEFLRSVFRWLYNNADAVETNAPEGLRLKYVAWFVYRDRAASCTRWECWESVSGLKRSDGSARPAWCGYAHLIRVNPGLCEYIPPNSSSDVYQTVTDIFYGQPGYVGIVGNVYLRNMEDQPVNNVRVNINFYREQGTCACENGNCPYVDTARADVINGAYSFKFWGKGVGRWCTKTVLYAQGNYAQSESGYHRFQIKSGYRLVARHSGKCLSLSGNNPANSTPMLQWDCSPNPVPWDGQVFSLIPVEPAAQYFLLKVNSSGRCLDVYGISPYDGGIVDQYDCIGAANQQWDIVPIAGQPPYEAFIARHSGKCLDVAGRSTANGAQIVQWACYWGGNQQWSWQAIE